MGLWCGVVRLWLTWRLWCRALRLRDTPQGRTRLQHQPTPTRHPTHHESSFKKAVEKGEVDEQEQKRQHARQSLERYMHYWQRWAENDSSRKKVHFWTAGAGTQRSRAWHAASGGRGCLGV